MKERLTVCISFFTKDLWKFPVSCEFLVCDLVVGHSFYLIYIGIWATLSKALLYPHSLVESDGLVVDCMHVDSTHLGLAWTIVNTKTFLFQFANHFSYNQSLRETKRIFNLV